MKPLPSVTRLQVVCLLAWSICLASYAGLEQRLPPKSVVTPTELPGAETFIYRALEPEPLRLHICKPANWMASDRRPAFLYFFGGGWQRGVPSVAWPRFAASLGLVGIAADYRTKERFGTSAVSSVADARAALRWVEDHAAELGIDERRIIVAGSSSGGHLALWAAMGATPFGSDPAAAPTVPPAGLVLISPVSDTSRASGFGWDRFDGHGDALSPYQQLPAGLPPVLLIHGDSDPVVNYTQSEKLAAKLKASGEVEFVTVPGGTHSFEKDLPGWAQKTRGLVEKFLSCHGLASTAYGGISSPDGPRRNPSLNP